MKLHLYFAFSFLKMVFFVGAGFSVLMLLIAMIDQARAFEKYDLSGFAVLQMTLLTLPKQIYQILPLIILLATIGLFLKFARTSELVVARASGRSALETLLAPVLGALGIGLFALTILSPITAISDSLYVVKKNQIQYGAASGIIVDAGGLKLRDKSAGKTLLIQAQHLNEDATDLSDVLILVFSEQSVLLERLEAPEAVLSNGKWTVYNAQEWVRNTDGILIQNPTPLAKRTFQSTHKPQDIKESATKSDLISFWRMPGFIKAQQHAGLAADKYIMRFQSELALPFFLISIVLIGAAFTMSPHRGGNVGNRIIIAIIAGFSLYFIRNLSGVLGEDGRLPVLLAAWAPPIATLFLAAATILHLEDG
ncbi:MAG: LPS export ABC transporter permease LptG [Halocynthiibacter sp.]